MTGCHGCGSQDGSAFQLCPACIQAKSQSRTAHLSTLRNTAAPSHETDMLYALTNSIWMYVAGIFTLFTVFSVSFLFWGPLVGEGVVPVLVFSVMTSAGMISTLILLFFWTRMIVNDFMWGLVTLIFPCFVYRYVYLNWDDGTIRLFTYIQIICGVITLGAAFLLTTLLKVELIEVLALYQLYFRGIGLPI